MEMVETMGEDGEGADGDGDGAVWEDNALCAELVRIVGAAARSLSRDLRAYLIHTSTQGCCGD